MIVTLRTAWQATHRLVSRVNDARAEHFIFGLRRQELDHNLLCRVYPAQAAHDAVLLRTPSRPWEHRHHNFTRGSLSTWYHQAPSSMAMASIGPTRIEVSTVNPKPTRQETSVASARLSQYALQSRSRNQPIHRRLQMSSWTRQHSSYPEQPLPFQA